MREHPGARDIDHRVKLSVTQLREFSKILTRIEEGRIDAPRVPGPVGTYLRQYAGARNIAAQRMALELPERGWLSGEALGPVELMPITPLELSLGNGVISSVTSTLVVSETLGTTLRVTLWGSALTAGRLVRLWRRQPDAPIHLEGPYRWYPPARITPGEAATSKHEQAQPTWCDVRCLKYTGDDIGRVPIAATCHLDWSSGRPGIKSFRTVALRRTERQWTVAPGLMDRTGKATFSMPKELDDAHVNQILVLAYTEPWTPDHWMIVDAKPASDDEVLAHNIAWADHLRELHGDPPVTGAEIRGLALRLHEDGLAPSIDVAVTGTPLDRHVAAGARPFAAWMRGVA
jgi:hypothetical protein